jgi:hypothetical protein
VTEELYEELRAEYDFTRRGLIQVKGKRLMNTYLLTGRRAAREERPVPRPALYADPNVAIPFEEEGVVIPPGRPRDSHPPSA